MTNQIYYNQIISSQFSFSLPLENVKKGNGLKRGLIIVSFYIKRRNNCRIFS